MCILSALSKYITVPILSQWLHKVDLLLLDTALVNQYDRSLFISLMKQYLHLMDGGMFNAGRDMNLLELCGWYGKYGLPSAIICSVDCCEYDLTRVKDYTAVNEVIEKVQVLKVYGAICCDLIKMQPQMNRVQSLTIVSTNVHAYMNMQWTRLTSLTLTAANNIDIHAFSAICRNCPLLEYINAGGNFSTVRIPFFVITVHCRNLVTLFFGSIDNIRNFYIFCLHGSRRLTVFGGNLIPSDKIMSTFFHYKGDNLAHLSLSHSTIYGVQLIRLVLSLVKTCCSALIAFELPYTKSEDVFLSAISLFSKQLTSIVYGIPEANNVLAECVRCHALKSFTVDGQCRILNDELLEIVRNCPLLEYLNLYNSTGLTNGYLEAIAPYCGNISTLKLPYVPLVTPAQSPLELCSMLLNIPSLTTLYAKLSKSQDKFSMLQSKCKLTCLTLYGNINDAQFLSLMSACCHLKSLTLTFNHVLTTQSLIRIAPICKRLNSLSWFSCSWLDTSSMDSLKTHFPRCELI